jgi:putative transcriptional regulator
MNPEIPSTLKGHLLMAMPALADPNFRRSVTCVTEYSSEGAVGIVVNQIHPWLSGPMIFDELGMAQGPFADKLVIHIGGPVHTNELFILHGPPLEWEHGLIIKEGLALSNSRDILAAIAQGRGPKRFILALGCAGWGPGQLEWEMKQNAWLTLPCNDEVIFHTPVEARWKYAIMQLGIDPDSLSVTAGTA